MSTRKGVEQGSRGESGLSGEAAPDDISLALKLVHNLEKSVDIHARHFVGDGRAFIHFGDMLIANRYQLRNKFRIHHLVAILLMRIRLALDFVSAHSSVRFNSAR